MKLGPYDLNTIITGDARELAKAIPDESVDLVLTDPPFGIGFKYSNDYNDDPKQYPDLVRWIIKESSRVIKPGGLCFVFVAQPQLRHVWPLFPDDSRIFAACKNFVQLRPTPVQFSYDPVIFWRKDGERLKEYRGRDWHIGNTNPMSRKDNVKFHSCPRPLDTIIYMVDNFCPRSGIVLDWFMGSGTTAVASKVLHRNWWGSEIDADTAELARERVRNTQPPLFVLEPEQERLPLELGLDKMKGI